MAISEDLEGKGYAVNRRRSSLFRTASDLGAFVRASLRTGGRRVIFIASAAGYWLLYALSTGIIAYFSYNALSQVLAAGGTNPVVVNFLAYWQYPANVYESGLLWFVTPHVMLSILIGPVFFSTVLSLLFGTNMLIFGSIARRGAGSGRRGFIGLTGLIPAVFSGSCCYAPLGLIAIVSIFNLSLSQSGALYALSYTYQILDNVAITLLMLLSSLYSYGKLRDRSCCAPFGQGKSPLQP
jgi:hypothetical protein